MSVLRQVTQKTISFTAERSCSMKKLWPGHAVLIHLNDPSNKTFCVSKAVGEAELSLFCFQSRLTEQLWYCIRINQMNYGKNNLFTTICYGMTEGISSRILLLIPTGFKTLIDFNRILSYSTLTSVAVCEWAYDRPYTSPLLLIASVLSGHCS